MGLQVRSSEVPVGAASVAIIDEICSVSTPCVEHHLVTTVHPPTDTAGLPGLAGVTPHVSQEDG